MHALPALVTAVLLLVLPARADEPVAMQLSPSDLAESVPVVASPIPEPRSMIFVGLGALVILFVALRRK